jgi:hypothetical protein
MNFGWLRDHTPDEEYARVVLHELGHAIGCVHEHQHPETPIQWNKQAVALAFSGPPNFWSPADIEANVLHRYAKGETQFSQFDPTSIMIYPIPAALTLDGASFTPPREALRDRRRVHPAAVPALKVALARRRTLALRAESSTNRFRGTGTPLSSRPLLAP